MRQGTAASWFSGSDQAGNLAADTATNHQEPVAQVEHYPDAGFIVRDGPHRLHTRGSEIPTPLNS